MAYVNLLPWRQHERLRARNRFFVHLAVFALAAAAVVLVIHLVMGEIRYQQQSRNQYLQQHIGVLNGQLAEIAEINKQKASILQRMDLIQALHHDRNTAVKIVNELAERTPQGLYLINIEKRGNTLYIDGRSASNNRVSELLRNLKDSPIFENPSLQQVISDRDGNDRYDVFSLSTTIIAPPSLTDAGANNGA